MYLDDDARVVLSWMAETTADVLDDEATVELQVRGARYPMSWNTMKHMHGVNYGRGAITQSMLAGSRHDVVEGDIRLDRGKHPAQVILTLPDGQVLPSQTFYIQVG